MPEPLVLARVVRDAVLAVPGVASLTSGRHGGTVTYGPGEIVRGVAVRRHSQGYAVEIRFVAEAPLWADLVDLANDARSAALRAAERHGLDATLGVDVVIDDFTRSPD